MRSPYRVSGAGGRRFYGREVWLLCSHQQCSSGGPCRAGWGIEQLGPGCVLLRQIIVQNHVEQRRVNPNASVVFDVAELSKAIHEEADAGPGGADHRGKSLLGYRWKQIGR